MEAFQELSVLGTLGSCQHFIILFVNGRQLNGHELINPIKLRDI